METLREQQHRSLSADQRKWVEKAWSEIDENRLAELNRKMASIPSPTGQERELAEFMVGYMKGAGIAGFYQPIDDHQGNSIGRLQGSAGGPDLLLYAPLDTAFSGVEEEDCPFVGIQLAPEMTTDACIKDGHVVGLGAENPKGYAACLVAATEAVFRAGIPLSGSVIIGLGAGGMPTNKRPGISRFNAGQGTGCAFMLEQGIRGDFAIIAKPGYAVAWEEVGLCWFKVRVLGEVGYTGTRHVLETKNSIVHAAKVITALEEWFAKYTERNTSGLVAPQGSINAIQAGWSYKTAFIPAVCDLHIDLRISPRTDPMDAKRQFGEAIEGIQAANPGLDLNWEMILAIPGASTDPNNWIIQSCIRAWEFVEGRKHTSRRGTSGATDANILRAWGVPTARLGIPRPQSRSEGRSRFSMDVCSVSAMKQLTKCLVYSIIDTCTRDRREVGLFGTD